MLLVISYEQVFMCFSFGDPGGKKATHAPYVLLVQLWHDYSTVISIDIGVLIILENYWCLLMRMSDWTSLFDSCSTMLTIVAAWMSYHFLSF